MKPMPKTAYWLVPLFPVIGVTYAIYFIGKLCVAIAVMILCHIFGWEAPDWIDDMIG